MKNTLKVVYIFLSVSCIIFLSTSLLYCQPNIGSATSATDRFGREAKKKGEEMLRPPKKTFEVKEEKVAPEAGEKKFFVKKIALEGCESFPPESFAKLINKYENREVGLSELNVLARDIEGEYLKRGVISAVFLPPQEVKEGLATLRVVEARMGELQVQDTKYFSKKVLKRYWKIKTGEIIRYDKMSRSIQMMNKNPDREVRATLKAGAKQGTTDVILTPKTSFPIHPTFSFDNDGSLSTGKYRTGLGIRDNNALGLDDSFMYGDTFGKDFNGYYFYHNIPISSVGTSLLYGANKSMSSPKMDFIQYDMRSYAEGASMSIHQDIYNRDVYIGEAFIGFDLKDKRVTANTGGTINKDRLRVLSMGFTYIMRTMDSVLYITPEYDQGLRILGASSGGNPLASRNASSVYSKFLVNLQERTRLPLGLQQTVKIKSQFASEKLTPQEQFSLGGIDSVRGYPPSDYYADTAVLTNYEILVPMIVIPKSLRLPKAKNSLRDSTTGVLFFDCGYGQARGQIKGRTMMGVGLGIRCSIYEKLTVRLEWGFPLGGDGPLSEGPVPGRLHFSIEY